MKALSPNAVSSTFRHFTIISAIAVSHCMCIASLRHKPNTNSVGIIAIYIVHWTLRGEYPSSYSSYQKMYKGTIFKLGVLFRLDVLVHIIYHFESV
jgi:hypothetical protein